MTGRDGLPRPAPDGCLSLLSVSSRLPVGSCRSQGDAWGFVMASLRHCLWQEQDSRCRHPCSWRQKSAVSWERLLGLWPAQGSAPGLAQALRVPLASGSSVTLHPPPATCLPQHFQMQVLSEWAEPAVCADRTIPAPDLCPEASRSATCVWELGCCCQHACKTRLKLPVLPAENLAVKPRFARCFSAGDQTQALRSELHPQPSIIFCFQIGSYYST